MLNEIDESLQKLSIRNQNCDGTDVDDVDTDADEVMIPLGRQHKHITDLLEGSLEFLL